MTIADLLYKTWAAIWNNKQTILGSGTAVLAFIQANPKLRDLLEATTYEWTMLIVGCVMILFARSTAGGAISKVIPGSIPHTLTPPEGP